MHKQLLLRHNYRNHIQQSRESQVLQISSKYVSVIMFVLVYDVIKLFTVLFSSTFYKLQRLRHVDWRYHLGEDVYFIIKAPQLKIHIRKHFVPNGEWTLHPTKRGVILSLYELKELNKIIPLFEDREPELTIDNVYNKVSKLVYVVCYIYSSPKTHL